MLAVPFCLSYTLSFENFLNLPELFVRSEKKLNLKSPTISISLNFYFHERIFMESDQCNAELAISGSGDLRDLKFQKNIHKYVKLRNKFIFAKSKSKNVCSFI